MSPRLAALGDAAASNDPCFGQGLSLTVRSVRVLRDHLLSYNDWDAAGHAYAAAQDRDYGVVHRVTQWLGICCTSRAKRLTSGAPERCRYLDKTTPECLTTCSADLTFLQMTPSERDSSGRSSAKALQEEF